MEIDFTRIQELVNRPGESLSIEIKRWIDPESLEGMAKIVRAVLALRNHGGGYLVIGFDNDTLQPDNKNAPQDVRSKFHSDRIQSLVSRFASEPFEIKVELPGRDDQIYPVIVVPPGVKTPVAARAELKGTKPISIGDVYVRSLRANNTPSTTKAGWQDWPKIAETCFDNREADVGRFLRRHLAGLTPEILLEIGSALTRSTQPRETTEELLESLLQESEQRYDTVTRERGVELPEHGTWETALIINNSVPPHSANQEFLNLLASSNPRYTGWPVWLDSRGFRDESSRPYVVDGAWEALIVGVGGRGSDYIDFMRLDPDGRFYLRRALQDDTSHSPRVPEPLAVLDFGLVTIRTAEAIAVGNAFAKAMGCDPEKSVLSFGFRWKRLKGRQLTSWANPERSISSSSWRAYQDEVLSFADIPLETPLSALGEYVYRLTRPLFEAFDGFSLSKDVTEELTRQLIERRL